MGQRKWKDFGRDLRRREQIWPGIGDRTRRKVVLDFRDGVVLFHVAPTP